MSTKRSFWLAKTEPETYGWKDLEKKGTDRWDGVRNYQARNFLKEMKLGDWVFIYHSGKHREVVGIAEVVKAAYPDPSDRENKWVAIDLIAKQKLNNPVSLDKIKASSIFEDSYLLKQSRLSVMPLSDEMAGLLTSKH